MSQSIDYLIDLDLPVFEVECPQCKTKRRYSPKKRSMTLKTMKFTCKKCHKQTRVKSHITKIVRKIQKKPKKVKKNTKKVTKKSTQVPKRELLPLPLTDPGFFWFSRWVSFPHFRGMFKWQKDHENLTKDAKYEMTLVPRDHGKSVKYEQKYQYMMWYKDYDVLLLGWTDRRKEIALFVYTFFNNYGLIVTDKRTSPYHFRLTNGAKFDCYLITGKEALGMHSLGKEERFANLTPADMDDLKAAYDPKELMELEDGIFDDKAFEKFIKDKNKERKLWISIDDPIDISFMKERWKEEDLELRFSSTLYSINPDKWSFTGTHKFEGDIFDFWIGRFGKKLIIYKQPPILPDGSLLCPEMFTHPSLKTYEQDLQDGKKDLDEIRTHIGPYAWSSDWCQDPHPTTGDVWDHVDLVYMLDGILGLVHDICFISIDRATTRKVQAAKKKADYTGCVIGLRHMKTGFRYITHDFTDYIDIDELLLQINDFVIQFRARYEHIMLVLIVETQGGGSDFVTLVRNSAHFIRDDGTLIANKIREFCMIHEIHNTGEKEQRIRDRLNTALKNMLYKFLSTLQKSPIVNQILSFPNCNKFDAIDALANVEFILLEEYPLIVGMEGNRLQQITDVYKRAKSGELSTKLRASGVGFDMEAFEGRSGKKNRRRNVFDEF